MPHSATEIEGLLLVVRLIVGATLALAGFGKLLDPSYARVGMRRHGVPDRWSLAAVVAMSLLELLVAFGLATAAHAWVASIAATVLLLASVSVVVANLGRGAADDCR